MMKEKLEKLSRENLQRILLSMSDILSDAQTEHLEALIDACETGILEEEGLPRRVRLSQELVEEKMGQLQEWMEQIDEGELYLNADEYEDYSSGYWDRDLITDYYDNQGIGDRLMTAIQFAGDCVDDRRYKEANFIYEWLWQMSVYTDIEEGDPVDMEILAEEGIIRTDMEKLALLTLYADYQVQEPQNRAEDIFLYFSIYPFYKLHIEDMFHVGRENLQGTEQFLKDWIALLKTKKGDVAARLLREAVLYREGIPGLIKVAEENCDTHPSLYLEAMKEYERNHDYSQIEEIGEKALDKIDSGLLIRSKIALKAAQAASYLMHSEKVMRFCWEGFCSDSTGRNFLRLFGTKEMAEQYGLRGREVLQSRDKGKSREPVRNAELARNIMCDHTYYELSFYTGNFAAAKQAAKNPRGSLGWTGSFIRTGLRLFLLYLCEGRRPSAAVRAAAEYMDFSDKMASEPVTDFETTIVEECRAENIPVFWNYFQRWKQYFSMDEQDKKKYLAWAKEIAYSRADAIVGGQHRGSYAEAAMLLALTAEAEENMGAQGARQDTFAQYKKKFPRHSSFQAEMKKYFGIK